jgi:hypothetical protein
MTVEDDTTIEVVTVEPGGSINQSLDPSLNGYVKGNGSGNFTAAATIPQSDIVLATDLAAVEGIGTTGIAVRTAANTWATRTLQAGQGIAITEPAGLAGDPSIALGANLAALDVISGSGLAARTGVNTWALRTLTGTSNRLSVANGAGAAGNPTVDIDAAYVGQASITTVGTVTSGTWAASFPSSGGVNSTGEMGIRTAANSARALSIGTPSSVSTQLQAVDVQTAAPSTTTLLLAGYRSIATTAAAAFTVTNLVHFYAVGAAPGAGSTITNARGFYAQDSMAVGTNNYGFYSDINAATTTWQLYMGGTGSSFFNGPVGIVQTDPTSVGALVAVGSGAVSHPNSSINIRGVSCDYVVPATATTLATGFHGLLRTVNSAFTLTTATLFLAAQVVKGAASTITNVRGFHASTSITGVATNTYGFYSDINTATSTWQLYMSGTGVSYLGGALGILHNDPIAKFSVVHIGNAALHPVTGTTGFVVSFDITAPSTMTASLVGVRSSLKTAATAFTLVDMTHFHAVIGSKGAGSSINNVRGFYAADAIAVGTSNYAFYSDINSAANTYQLNMAGTALNQLKGGLILDTTAAPTVGASQVGFGATTASTVGAAGAASALPANPLGYLIANVAGTQVKIPYYNN